MKKALIIVAAVTVAFVLGLGIGFNANIKLIVETGNLATAQNKELESTSRENVAMKAYVDRLIVYAYTLELQSGKKKSEIPTYNPDAIPND